jgi:hypothetical protein
MKFQDWDVGVLVFGTCAVLDVEEELDRFLLLLDRKVDSIGSVATKESSCPGSLDGFGVFA